MKTRLLFFFLLAAGVITGWVLIRPHLSSPPPNKEVVRPEELARLTSTPSASTLISPPSLPLTAEEIKASSPKVKPQDLIQQIQAALKTGESAGHDLVFTNLLLELIKKDPRAAAGLAESQEAGPLREEMLRRVAQHWTEQDSASARQWAGQLSDLGERNAALTDVCFQIAQADPGHATQLADQYELGKLPGATLENLVQQWAAQDVTTATAWVKERPAGEQKEQMLMRLAMVIAETSPAEAAQLVVNQIPEGSVQTEAAISVVHQWARRDLSGARAWVELFPEGPLRERALNELKGIEQYQQAAK